MRLLLVGEYFPPVTLGGAEWSIHELAAGLGTRGHAVTVVTVNWGSPPRERAEGFRIRRVRIGARRVGDRFPTWYFRTPAFHFRLGLAVVAEARRVHAEAVHACTANAVPAAWLAARMRRLPLIVTLRDTQILCPLATCLFRHRVVPADCSARKLVRECMPEAAARYGYPAEGMLGRLRKRLGYLDALFKQALIRRADAVVGISRSILGIHVARGVVRGPSAVVHNPPPPPASPPPGPGWRSEPYVVAAGKLSVGKGTDVLVEAARRLHERGVRGDVVLAGRGQAPEPLPPNVHVLGPVPHGAVAGLMAGAAAAVVPSVWPEPFSRIPMEAAAVGTPSVVTDAGGSPEAVVAGETGLVVPRGDPQALAEALERVLRDPAEARRMGMKARDRFATELSRERAFADMEAVYRAACQERSP